MILLSTHIIDFGGQIRILEYAGLELLIKKKNPTCPFEIFNLLQLIAVYLHHYVTAVWLAQSAKKMYSF